MNDNVPSITPSPTPPSVVGAAPEAAAQLPIDLACVACGYNLRGLVTDSRCPECGELIAESLDPHLLRFAPPAYVHGLAAGLTLMFAGGSLCIITTMVITVLIGMLDGNPEAFVAVGFLTTGLIAIVGTWLLTTPDPQRRREHPLSMRRVARVVLVSVLAVPMAVSILDWLIGESEFLTDLMWYGPEVYASILALLGLFGLLAELIYLIGLAQRVPDRRLGRELQVNFWGIIATVVAIFAVYVIEAEDAFGPIAASRAFEVAVIVVSIAPTVFGLGWIFALLHCRPRFRNCAKAAKANWAAGVRVIDGRVRLPRKTGESSND